MECFAGGSGGCWRLVVVVAAGGCWRLMVVVAAEVGGGWRLGFFSFHFRIFLVN